MSFSSIDMLRKSTEIALHRGAHRNIAYLRSMVAVVAAVLVLSLTLGMAAAKTSTRASKPRQIVPSKTLVQSRSGPIKQDKTSLVPFDAAPFPYHGTTPGGAQFLNVNEDGRRGRRTFSGRVYWEDKTYSDNRVLLHIPKGFDIRRPALMLVFFHGHGATLERDVLARQKVPAQISASNANVVLVAPQLAFDASDSSAGKLWQPGGFGQFIGEAGQKLAALHGDPKSLRTFASMPIVIVAYSGGYVAAGTSIERGGLRKRIRGVVLLDSLYGDLDKFAHWIEADPSAFFVSVYLGSTRNQNSRLEDILATHDVDVAQQISSRLATGGVAVVPGGSGSHRDLVTRAWVDYPIIDLLKRLPEYRR